MGASSIGKTTLARAAASLYGSGADDGYKHGWNITDNALESLAEVRSDSLLILDEMSQANPKHVGQCAYMYANGQGKARANQHGNARPVARWRGFALSTGEQGLAELLQQAQSSRLPASSCVLLIFRFPTRAGAGACLKIHGHPSAEALANRIREASSSVYGTAGPAFVSALTQYYDDVMAACGPSMDMFVARVCPPETGEQVRRVARKFALIAMAGELATDFGITPWEPGAACAAAERLFYVWQDARGGTGNAEAGQALDRLRAYLEQHAGHFSTCNRQAPSPCAGYITRTKTGERKWLIFPSVWRDIFQGRDASAAAKLLAGMGVLRPRGPGDYQRTCRIPGRGTTTKSFYVINDAALGVAIAEEDREGDGPARFAEDAGCGRERFCCALLANALKVSRGMRI